jgi:hypothetical protein
VDSPVAGTLQVFTIAEWVTASLTVNASKPEDALHRRVHPVLVSAGHGQMRPRGYERRRGRLYAQDWLREIDTSDAARTTRPRFSSKLFVVDGRA